MNGKMGRMCTEKRKRIISIRVCRAAAYEMKHEKKKKTFNEQDYEQTDGVILTSW